MGDGMNNLINYIQWQYWDVDDIRLDELCKKLINNLVNSPYIMGTTVFKLNQCNNINFAIEKINSNIKPIWEWSGDDKFILRGWAKRR